VEKVPLEDKLRKESSWPTPRKSECREPVYNAFGQLQGVRKGDGSTHDVRTFTSDLTDGST